MTPLMMCALALVVICRPAFAYIDPGSGHFIWQLLLSMAAGAAFTLRRVWRWRWRKRGDQPVDTSQAPKRSAK